MTLGDRISDAMMELDIYELVELHNQYCYCTNLYVDLLNEMEWLETIKNKLIAVFNAKSQRLHHTEVDYSDFNQDDEFYKVVLELTPVVDLKTNLEKFDVSCKVESINICNVGDYIAFFDIIKYIIDNEDSLSNDDIQEVLDEWEEEEEEEE